IVYDLGEEIEEEFRIIPTTEFIKNIDVIYEEISLEEIDDFVITSMTSEKKEPLEFEDENQISLTFDLPISKVAKKIELEKEEINIKSNEFFEQQIVKLAKEVKEDVYFSLEDYTELEENLTNASKPIKIDEEVNNELNFTYRYDSKVESEIDIKNCEVIDHIEISPLDLTIDELQKRAAQRREKMKNFNYKFVNRLNKNIDEIEKEPAYKRMGVQLDETSHSSEINQSRTSLEVDESDALQFRSNNSFLHDNVD
ncbi:MAG: cell division protein FtsZ, partial [Lutibacter sp.]|nr:cell division protein FtsZ [Lutibacter sp.]